MSAPQAAGVSVGPAMLPTGVQSLLDATTTEREQRTRIEQVEQTERDRQHRVLTPMRALDCFGADLAQELGREPSDEEYADRFAQRLVAVREVLRAEGYVDFLARIPIDTPAFQAAGDLLRKHDRESVRASALDLLATPDGKIAFRRIVIGLHHGLTGWFRTYSEPLLRLNVGEGAADELWDALAELRDIARGGAELAEHDYREHVARALARWQRNVPSRVEALRPTLDAVRDAIIESLNGAQFTLRWRVGTSAFDMLRDLVAEAISTLHIRPPAVLAASRTFCDQLEQRVTLTDLEGLRAQLAREFALARQQCRRTPLNAVPLPPMVPVVATPRSPETPTASGELGAWVVRCGGSLICSPDYATIRRGGDSFSLTPTQRACLRFIIEAWEHGRREFTNQELLAESGSTASYIRDAFRSNGKSVPAWNRLIVEVEGKKGSYTLCLTSRH